MLHRFLVSQRRVHLRIRGLVQGVSYRAFARDEAQRLALGGWVRNLPGGDVEAVAQGAPEAVEAFVAWCQHGPDEARVESVTAQDEQAASEFTGFQVLR